MKFKSMKKTWIPAIILLAVFTWGLGTVRATTTLPEPRNSDFLSYLPIVTKNTGTLLLHLEMVADDLPTVTNLTHAGDGRRFVSLRDGRIFVIAADNSVRPVPYLDISERIADVSWEQGLLGLVFHPEFASNGYFYIYYTPNDTGERVAPGVLSRLIANPSGNGPVDSATEVVMLTIPHNSVFHYGGQLQFGPDGYLYVGSGDGTSRNAAQDGSSLLGKILRLDVNNVAPDPYGIPPDNPFVNVAGFRDEIWALGLRNPWRFSFDWSTGDLFISDVGENTYEEINVAPTGMGGLNFGWPCYEGPDEFAPLGCPPPSSFEFPAHTYQHGDTRCSVIGGYVYRGHDYPQLDGHYLFGDLCSGEIWAMSSTGSGWSVEQAGIFPDIRWSTFGEDRDGELYAGEWAGQNRLFRILGHP
jgi:glucose/arabinose dehydrogenase